MKNRNMVIFIVLSTLLLGSYNLFMARLGSSKSVPHLARVDKDISQLPSNNLVSMHGLTSDATTDALSCMAHKNSPDLIKLSNQTVELTWNKTNGALTQVLWSDGTSFFPDYSGHGDIEPSSCFPGIGVPCGVKFSGDPQVSHTVNGKTVAFKSSSGESLIYTVPNQGHVVDVEWISPNSFALSLIPKPSTLLATKGLGRVFAIKEDSIKATSWVSILKDPSIGGFFGIKRKDFPSATRWVGMDAGVDTGKSKRTTHYFAVIWDVCNGTQSSANEALGYVLAPDETGKARARLYLGPKQAEMLTLFNTGSPKDGGMFKQVVDFGFFGLVAKLLFIVLHAIHAVVPNWGWAIILFTIVIRGILWPLNNKTTMQMLRMKELEPFQKALQAKYEKFGNDTNKKAEMQKELMAFYKKNGYNPMGGCLPTLLQMPVFFALWSMLSAVFELRNAPFLGWLVDLSSHDPYYVLPVMMGASMIAQQMIAPAVGDPNQRKIMMVIMPVMLSFFFANTPSGLCLYYLMFNIIGIFQTWLVTRSYKPQPVVM